MSQKKVDQYKEYKKNKDKILKQEKMKLKLQYALMGLIALVLCVWLVFSAVTSVERAKKAEAEANAPVATEVDMNGYADYVGGLQTNFSE
ncbi:MAG: hypothetical protein J6D14_03310 [Lachnospiraceae bacterium]|nr:hypothetical protein [Lachnospiraceae bacterium]